MIFVFGSNLAGRHGKGAARHALEHHGAVYGEGYGRFGNSFAIPTKDEKLKRLGLKEIALYLRGFAHYAAQHSEETFLLTPVGCGLAGHSRSRIAALLQDITLPDNVVLHRYWIGGRNSQYQSERTSNE